ncbi:ankyrin repeat-containing domain protein [Fusarium solani]|uniref:Ankyrin repeat-containing domain protein n=1 Tax=Fusarium solani TaxID=169388 RepID=A0A9P9R788_FUSSL|nr:ankyrin repeat-containing domain protein [Fusarium solani]KAH7268224.1 ankyrin repeat-containing domain protein [Fusarium solani]
MKVDERGTADELLFRITNCKDEEDGHMYHCLYCADDFGSEFPIMSVPIGVEPDDGHHGINLGIRDDRGCTPLMVAAEMRPELVVELILTCSTDADVQDLGTGKSWPRPLHLAAARKSPGIVRKLINRGAQVNARMEDNFGATLVHLAAQQGDLQVLEAMFEAQVELDFPDGLGQTALHLAVGYGHQKVVPWLQRKGFDIDKPNAAGVRPLEVALGKQDFDMARLLVGQGAGIDGMPSTHHPYLHVAAYHGILPVLDFLLQHGASANIRNTERHTPVMVAAARGSCDCISRLIKAGANVDASGPDQFTAACYAILNGHQEVLQLLLDHGADPHVQASGSNNLLHMAAMKGWVPIGKLLLKQRISRTAKNLKGGTPLDIAKLQGQQDFVSLLKVRMTENQKEARGGLGLSGLV